MLLGEPPLLAILSSFPEKKIMYDQCIIKLYLGFLNYLNSIHLFLSRYFKPQINFMLPMRESKH